MRSALQILKSYPLSTKYVSVLVLCILLFTSCYLVYAQTSGTIRKNVYAGNVHVGGFTRREAITYLQQKLSSNEKPTINLIIEDNPYPIPPSDIGLGYDVAGAIDNAWGIGKAANPLTNVRDLFALFVTTQSIPLTYTFDKVKLKLEIGTIAKLVDQPGKDIRLFIEGTSVEVLTDTKPGYILNQELAYQHVEKALTNYQNNTEPLYRAKVEPTVSLESASGAKVVAERILAEQLKLAYDQGAFTITQELIGRWITSTSKDKILSVGLDEAAISAHVTTIARELDAEPQSPRVTVVDGRVTEFTAPRSGQRLNQTKAVADILTALTERQIQDSNENSTEDPLTSDNTIELEVTVEKPEILDASAAELGIVELIGKASTRFTGSPPNRISNIKNGVKFLSGILIPPGEEFSTLKALGRVDNTTGYLPELVIKENRTIPEYGGGLCQVSTTLFRATMNAGLPITARQNHSYRVIYYERDGDGNYIGPGLDATIYNPAPDFRFINDTKAHILIQGSVEGDKITFAFYGTRDGRSSTIDGPYTLSTTPAGEPIYVETDELKSGEKKQIERAHAGGTAIATYTITYSDGTTKTTEYKSYYRNWPAQYLVGREPTPAPEQEGEQPPSTPPETSGDSPPSSENPTP